MKNLKKLTALFLTIAMVIVMGLSMGMNAQAAEKSSVTVKFVSNVDGKTIPSPGEGTYSFTIGEGKTVHDAIVAVGNTLDPKNPVEEGQGSTYKYINSIFGYSTVNNYGDHYWEGYYWNLSIKGQKADGTYVTFESPLYASQIALGESVHFENEYDSSFTPVDCVVTEVTMTYMHDEMTWD